MSTRIRKPIALATLLSVAALCLLLTACNGPDPMDDDDLTFTGKQTTKLVQEDVSAAADQVLEKLMASRWVQSLSAEKPVRITMYKLSNTTGQTIDPLEILQRMELPLTNDPRFEVIDRELIQARLNELGLQSGEAFDPSQRSDLGEQLGATFWLTGSMTGGETRVADKKRQDYRLTVKVSNIAKGVVVFAGQIEIRKGIEK